MERAILGRGLRALIPLKKNQKMKSTDSIVEIPLSLIKPNKNQPRVVFEEKYLNELAESIQRKGLLQPILLKKKEEKEEKYEIIAGERRFRAFCQLKILKIPAIIKEVSSEESCEIALIENLQRKDLNWIEKASSYRRIMNLFHMTQEQLSLKIGLSRSSVTNTLRLLKLPKDIKEKIEKGLLSFAQAKILLSIPSSEKQRSLVRKLLKDKINAFELNQYLKKEKKKKILKKERVFANEKKKNHFLILSLEKKLKTIFHFPVKLERSAEKKILVKYQSLDQLESLIQEKISDLSLKKNS